MNGKVSTDFVLILIRVSKIFKFVFDQGYILNPNECKSSFSVDPWRLEDLTCLLRKGPKKIFL